MSTDIIRVLRIIEYQGPRDWVEKTLSTSIYGTKYVSPDCKISAATIGSFPEILNKEESHENP